MRTIPFVFNPTSETSKSSDKIIDEVLRLFLSGQREDLNKLSANAGANATSLSFRYELGAIRSGSQVDVDMETYYVWSVDEGGQSATVEPGSNGSISATHADGSIVRVNPKISRYSIFSALQDEIRALSSPGRGLFSVMALEFPFSASKVAYDMTGTTDVLDVINVSILLPDGQKNWLPITSWRLDSSVNTTDFPSGNSIFVPEGISSQTVRVIYSAPFRVPTLSTDDLYLDGNGVPIAGGIPPSMQDILVYGTLLRLGPVREIKRNFTEAQGDSRRATEVTAGQVSNSYRDVRSLYSQRIDDERGRLIRYYPPASRR